MDSQPTTLPWVITKTGAAFASSVVSSSESFGLHGFMFVEGGVVYSKLGQE